MGRKETTKGPMRDCLSDQPRTMEQQSINLMMVTSLQSSHAFRLEALFTPFTFNHHLFPSPYPSVPYRAFRAPALGPPLPFGLFVPRSLTNPSLFSLTPHGFFNHALLHYLRYLARCCNLRSGSRVHYFHQFRWQYRDLVASFHRPVSVTPFRNS